MRLLTPQKRKHRQHRRRGAAMVEMAVCLPIFLLMILGIIEFGRGLMVSQMLTSASREGCRAAIIDGASETDVTQQMKDLVTATVGCNASDVNVDIVVTSVTTGNVLSGLSSAERRDLIEVDITVPFDAISYAGGRFLTGQTLRGQCAMRKE